MNQIMAHYQADGASWLWLLWYSHQMSCLLSQKPLFNQLCTPYWC